MSEKLEGIEDPDSPNYSEEKMKKFYKTKEGQQYLKIEKELDKTFNEIKDLRSGAAGAKQQNTKEQYLYTLSEQLENQNSTMFKEVKNASKDLSKRSQELVNHVNVINDNARKEAIKVINSKDFKNELEKRINDLLGNDFKPDKLGEEVFDSVKEEIIYDMIREPKYRPKTTEMVKKFEKDVNKYLDDVNHNEESFEKSYLGSRKNEKVPNLPRNDITYSDVVSFSFYKASKLDDLSRTLKDFGEDMYDDIDYNPTYMNVYTFDEYKRKYLNV